MPAVAKLPYFPEQALEMLGNFDAVVLAGAPAPVAFFGYPNTPSLLIPQGRMVETLATPEQDVALALEALADQLGAPRDAQTAAAAQRPQRPDGKLDATTIGAAIAAVMPENCIVMDEAATSGLPFFGASAGAPAHTYMALTGGAIGQGLPCATGAAVACPDRKVIAFQADGSGMYTLQALWTQAREGLDVTTLLFSNRSYAILRGELANVGAGNPGRKALDMLDLGHPDLDWVGLARSMGVPGARVTTMDAFNDRFAEGIAAPGPFLVEVVL